MKCTIISFHEQTRLYKQVYQLNQSGILVHGCENKGHHFIETNTLGKSIHASQNKSQLFHHLHCAYCGGCYCKQVDQLNPSVILDNSCEFLASRDISQSLQ